MPVSVVIGAQFGSEGKGKVAHFWAQKHSASVVVRVGGSNAGHTVVDSCNKLIFRHLPTSVINTDIICMLGAGSYIDPDIIMYEIESTGISSNNLRIDPNAYIITKKHQLDEQIHQLREKIGSTQSGTGAALIERVLRISETSLAKNHPQLKIFTRNGPVRHQLYERLRKNERIIIEGTQGFGLSLLHSPYYPKTTARDTTAAAFISEAGVSPLDVDEVILVMRAFPIRVPGNSGELLNEINWSDVEKIGGWSKNTLFEYTSVTKQLRRVATFDPKIVIDAIKTNNPTQIILNHADYFDFNSHNLTKPTKKVSKEVNKIESEIDRHINYIGLGPSNLVLLDKKEQ